MYSFFKLLIIFKLNSTHLYVGLCEFNNKKNETVTKTKATQPGHDGKKNSPSKVSSLLHSK